MAAASARDVPPWVGVVLLPVVNLLAAFFVSGLVILAIGENPLRALGIMMNGAFGYQEGIGFTLYFTTNFLYTGLAVAMAFHCGLFNIGGEGQATLGGLGVGLVLLWFDFLPFILILPLAIIASIVLGGLWESFPVICRRNVAAMSSSRRSCSTSSPQL